MVRGMWSSLVWNRSRLHPWNSVDITKIKVRCKIEFPRSLCRKMSRKLFPIRSFPNILSGKPLLAEAARAARCCVCRANGTSNPDARASTLDLSVLRSSRIARNSSYFVLIRKFVPVQLPRYSAHPSNFEARFLSFSMSSAGPGELVSRLDLRSPRPPAPPKLCRLFTSYLVEMLVDGNWNVDELPASGICEARLQETILIAFHYRQMTKNCKLRHVAYDSYRHNTSLFESTYLSQKWKNWIPYVTKNLC